MLIGSARQDQREPRGKSGAEFSFGRGCLSYYQSFRHPLVSESNPSPKEKGGPTGVL